MATETEALMLRLEANMKKYDDAIAKAHGKTNKAFGAIEARARQMEKTLSGLGRGALAFGASIGVSFGGAALVSDLGNTALQFDRINKALVAATGSSEGAKVEFEFVRQTANALGLELGSTAQQYAFLAAASRGTSLEGQKTRDIFVGVATAASTLGLSAADTAGVLNAVQQMISKGTVSAEELRGQMGERLPGAFAAAARAMGLTTEQLGKQLELGNVTADQLLPKLAAELKKVGNAAGERGLQGELNRLNNAYTELQLAFLNTGAFDVAVGGINALTNALRNAQVQFGVIASQWRTMQNEGVRLGGPFEGASSPMTPSEIQRRNDAKSFGRPMPQKIAQFGSKALGSLARGGDLLDLKPSEQMARAARDRLSSGSDLLGHKPPPKVGGGAVTGGGRTGGGGRRTGGGGGGRATSASGALREVTDLATLANEAIAEAERNAMALADDKMETKLSNAFIVNSQVFEEQERALKTVSDAYADMGDVAADAFDAIVERGASVEDVLKGILKQLASSAIRSLFGGSGGLGDSIGTVLKDIFGRASGGPVNARQPYLVGETGPELFIPRGPGRIAQAGGGGGSTSITIDLRGTTGDQALDAKLAMAVKTAVGVSAAQMKRGFGSMLMDHQLRRA